VFWPRHFHQATLSYHGDQSAALEAGMNYQEADDEILPGPGEYYGISGPLKPAAPSTVSSWLMTCGKSPMHRRRRDR